MTNKAERGHDREWTRRLRKKGWTYWAVTCLVALAGLYLSHVLDTQGAWISTRYAIHHFLQGRDPQKPYVQATVLVMIGDDEYWNGELARRVPIKRDYLARLLTHLDAANAGVVALDFDLRSPTTDGSTVEHPQYAAETRALLDTAKTVAVNRPVILPITLGVSATGKYTAESDIHSGFDWGAVQDNVRFGFIALAFDRRRVPMSLDLEGRGRTDSFALAIVRAYRPQALGGVNTEAGLPFGSYLPSEKFPQYTAGSVLAMSPATLKPFVANRIVIVGGAWSRFPHGRTGRIDTYVTPVGSLSGALIHANHVEALLSRRTSIPAPGWLVYTAEFLFVIAGAAIFTAQDSLLIRGVVAVGLCLGLMVLSYLLLQNLGMYFDAIVPLVLVAVHSLVDEVREWEIRRKLE